MGSSMGNGLWLLQYGLSWQFNTTECDCYGMVDHGCEMPWVVAVGTWLLAFGQCGQ